MQLSINKGLAAIKTEKHTLVKAKYNTLCAGKDPETGNEIYVDCAYSGGSIRMNAGKDAATSMDSGVRIFELSGSTHMPIVRDFYNTNHINVPIADARAIALQQAADALLHWQRKGELVDAINACTTVAEVKAITLTFTVNTL